jgi:hypothetical protein
MTVTGHLHTSVALPQGTALPVPTGWALQPPEHLRKTTKYLPPPRNEARFPDIYQSTRRHIPEDSTVLSWRLDVTKIPYIPVFLFRALYLTNGIRVKIVKEPQWNMGRT